MKCSGDKKKELNVSCYLLRLDHTLLYPFKYIFRHVTLFKLIAMTIRHLYYIAVNNRLIRFV